ncbi:hypothetical protein NZL82_10070 [Sphingomonas sanguinis]|nr:hypothetical protein [Sphingomonas sp. LC-1]
MFAAIGVASRLYAIAPGWRIPWRLAGAMPLSAGSGEGDIGQHPGMGECVTRTLKHPGDVCLVQVEPVHRLDKGFSGRPAPIGMHSEMPGPKRSIEAQRGCASRQ